MTFIRRLFTSLILVAALMGAVYWATQDDSGVASGVLVQPQMEDVSDHIADGALDSEVEKGSMAERGTSAAEVAVETREEFKGSAKIAVLKEILRSRNDNDPRLDTELKVLSVQDREELRKFYRHMRPEDRNGKGTAVFLLGRNLENPEDFQFLEEVVAEPACLSLSDCNMVDAPSAHDDHDQSSDITLAYPQLVALKSIERLLEKGDRDHLRDAEAVLKAAEKSENPRIRRTAQALRESMGPRRQ